jgi:hypothetical protein
MVMIGLSRKRQDTTLLIAHFDQHTIGTTTGLISASGSSGLNYWTVHQYRICQRFSENKQEILIYTGSVLQLIFNRINIKYGGHQRVSAWIMSWRQPDANGRRRLVVAFSGAMKSWNWAFEAGSPSANMFNK